jgi:NTP pyrophosphatase (non-canonical NTP hydrolase)
MARKKQEETTTPKIEKVIKDFFKASGSYASKTTLANRYIWLAEELAELSQVIFKYLRGNKKFNEENLQEELSDCFAAMYIVTSKYPTPLFTDYDGDIEDEEGLLEIAGRCATVTSYIMLKVGDMKYCPQPSNTDESDYLIESLCFIINNVSSYFSKYEKIKGLDKVSIIKLATKSLLNKISKINNRKGERGIGMKDSY